MKKIIRTRFAPSPSGHLHVGGARTALFNYLFAVSNGGQFILRVEDTDRERSTPESEKLILDSLDWLGLHADEGVREGGEYGPYRQSERIDIYKKYIQQLLDEKKAYLCFCSDKDLEIKQREARVLGKPYIYDGKCRNLNEIEIEQKLSKEPNYVVRFKVDPEIVHIDDMIQGRVEFDTRLIGDFIIQKSNGFPSYNYAVVVDDHEMRITHIIRGVGHLSNTPRQILIYRALALDLPVYAHSSEIVGTDHKKLSKRKGATSILLFKDLGYLPEAFINYMALLGWSPKNNEEFLQKENLEQIFSLENCSKSPAMFDFFLIQSETKSTIEEKTVQEPSELSISQPLEYYLQNSNKKSKLNWLNNLHIRAFPLEKIWKLSEPFILADEYLKEIYEGKGNENLKKAFDSLRVYLHYLHDAPRYLREIFKANHELSAELLDELRKFPDARLCLQTFCERIKEEQPKEPSEFKKCFQKISKELQLKGAHLYMPIRIASTASSSGLELPVLFSLLELNVLIERIELSMKQI